MSYFCLDLPQTRYLFDFIEGCSFACKYCNAFTNSPFIDDWKVWVKSSIKNIDKEKIIKEYNNLDKKSPINLDFIFVCSLSDPFQSEESEEALYDVLTILNNDLNLTTRILTKGVIPKWIKEFPKNSVGITITNKGMLNKHEKNGNLQTLKELTKNRIYTKLSLQPFNLNTTKDQIKEILNKTKFINQIVFGTLDKQPFIDFKKAFVLSDIIADFCIENKINFFNGSPRFNRVSKKRLFGMGITTPIWFGDYITC